MSNYSVSLLSVAFVLLAFAGGCGSSGIERAVVAGKVTLDGQPVGQGFIRFFPIQGTEGPMWGAQIIDGNYRADGKGGVPVGTHRVEIEAFRAVRNANPNPGNFEDFGGTGPAVAEVQYVPLRYNAESELELIVTPATSAAPVIFALER
jgi:hypothetical protein